MMLLQISAWVVQSNIQENHMNFKSLPKVEIESLCTSSHLHFIIFLQYVVRFLESCLLFEGI